MRGVGHLSQRRLERRVAKIEADWRIAKRRIETQADVAVLGDRQERVAAADFTKEERGRHPHVPWQIETLRRLFAGVLDECLELCLAFARDSKFRSKLVTGDAQLLVDVAARRIQLRGELVLDQRLIVLAGCCEAAAALEMVRRGPQLGALERCPRLVVVGPQAKRLRILGDRAVVVLALFGGASVTIRSRGGAAAGGQGRHDGNNRQTRNRKTQTAGAKRFSGPMRL